MVPPSLLNCKEIVAGDERGETQTRRSSVRVARIDEQVAGVAFPLQVPCDHRNDRLADLLVIPIILHNDGWPDLHLSCIREGEIDHDDFAAPGHGFLPYFC
jgi:hypothetical protein